MKPRYRILGLIILCVVLLVVAGWYAYQRFYAATPSTKITGTIVNITSRPNRAEDGYYGIEIRNGFLGPTYTVDATGFLNTPATPDDFGQACVTVPQLRRGDKVEFYLPKVPGPANTFSICYKKGATNYYIKKLP